MLAPRGNVCQCHKLMPRKRRSTAILRPGYAWNAEKGFHKIQKYKTMKERIPNAARAAETAETLSGLLAAAGTSIPYGGNSDPDAGPVSQVASEAPPPQRVPIRKPVPKKKAEGIIEPKTVGKLEAMMSEEPPPELRAAIAAAQDGALKAEFEAKKQSALPKEKAEAFVGAGWSGTAKPQQKFFFTGRLGTGKDYVAKALGAKVISFAEPLYAIASALFGITVTSTEGRDIPGVRGFLQAVGQWGRGVVTPEYPLTAERALFVQAIRAGGADRFGHPEVKWADFGTDPNIWLNAALARAEADEAPILAISNVRFLNEFEALQNAGWKGFHVMTSAKSWTERLAAQGLKPDAPQLKDVSEQLAAKLDASVIKQVSAQKTGATLRCIWSDSTVPPSTRLHTIESFLRSVNVKA